MRKKTAWAVGILSFLAGLVVVGYLLYDSLLPLFLAFALAYALAPS